MKSHALGLSRSNEGILSYENGAYEEATNPAPYVTRESERGVDLPLGRHADIKNGRGEVYRISVDDNNDFESPDYDGSDLSTGSRQRWGNCGVQLSRSIVFFQKYIPHTRKPEPGSRAWLPLQAQHGGGQLLILIFLVSGHIGI